ncbi:MAG: beta-ketoacyl-[acyl-carrier-protein] synthase family protein [Cyclobacteriaceae bacterium]
MKNNRVVITGVGVVAPNGTGKTAFKEALQNGTTAIKFHEQLKDLNFRCQIGAKVSVTPEYKKSLLPDFFVNKIKNNAIIYACLAGMEAWQDAGLPTNENETDYDAGIVFGSGDLSFDDLKTMDEFPVTLISRGDSKRLGSRAISESMGSGASAYLNNLLGLGNRTISNSSACVTGSEAILVGYEHIKSGRAKKMICGSTESDSHYIWGGFDAMRVLCSDSNDNPEHGSRPMSDTSSGFVPGGGSGALVLESLESAQARGAKIYAEIKGGEFNSGGQRNGGTMTAPNPEGVINCIQSAVASAEIDPKEIDLISGHLTSTKGDPLEIQNWQKALGLSGEDFPYVNTPKSMIGHCVGGAGSIELVACILQMDNDFIHKNLNCETLHPEIAEILPADKIPRQTINKKIDTVIKSNFGFGDLNCVLVLRKWNKND